jgi:hypothetical protein
MLIGTLWLFSPIHCRADKNPEEVKIPKSIYSELHYFLDLVDPEKNVSFNPGSVARVMEFIERPKNGDTLYFADGILGIPSAYHEFDSRTDFRKIADYAFNPIFRGSENFPMTPCGQK